MKQLRIKLIFNPTAGYGRKKLPFISNYLRSASSSLLNEIQHEFKKYNTLVDTVVIEKKQHTQTMVTPSDASHYDVVVVAGGDGTINSVINELINTPIPLGIIPVGSVNILAMSLNIPFSLSESIKRIINGKSSPIDLGKVDDRYFICMSGIGFDAKVIKLTPTDFKKRWGLLSFGMIALKLLLTYSFKPIHFRLDQNDHHKAFFMLIHNSKFYGGPYEISSSIKMNDGYLDICCLNTSSKYALLNFLFHLSRGSLVQCRFADFFKTQKIELTNSHHHHIHIDAEYIGKGAPFIGIKPNAINVIS